MYEEIQISRLYEQIVDQIENRILRGELKSGDRLPSENELAAQFGVSRTVVREAMKNLTQKGLITVKPGRGTFVIDSTSSATRHSIDLLVRIGSQDSLTDLIEVREILEPEFAALAAKRASPEQLASLRAAADVMDQATDNRERFIEADLDFHLALANASNNSLIPILIDVMVDLLRDYRRRAASVIGGIERSQPYHKQILFAVERRDATAARELMQEHLAQARKEIETAMQMEIN